jgi:hypothetical protein
VDEMKSTSFIGQTLSRNWSTCKLWRMLSNPVGLPVAPGLHTLRSASRILVHAA